jgi:transcriptional regulator with XRE-family HTH domain
MSFDAIKQFKHFLREWRNRAGLSLRELSNTSGVDHATISGLEKGRIKPPPKALEKLAKALNLSAEEARNLGEWSAALPNLKKISGSTTGLESGLLIRALALLADVPPNDVRFLWVQKPASNDYEAVILLKNGKALGFKITPDGGFALGEAFEEDDLPPASMATNRAVMTRPS